MDTCFGSRFTSETFNKEYAHSTGAYFFPNIVEYLFSIQTNGPPVPDKDLIVLLDPVVIKAVPGKEFKFACLVMSEAEIELIIYDMGGAKLRSLVKTLEKGVHVLGWDFRDDNKRPVEFGIKLVVMKVDGRVVAAKKIAVYR